MMHIETGKKGKKHPHVQVHFFHDVHDVKEHHALVAGMQEQTMRFVRSQATHLLFIWVRNTQESYRTMSAKAWQLCATERVSHIALPADIAPDLCEAALEGLLLASYSFNHYKTKKTDFAPSHILLDGRESLAERVQCTVAAITITRDWSNEPPNCGGTPEAYAAKAKALGKRYGFQVRVLDEKEARKENMHLFLGVGQGSRKENRFVIAEYAPKALKKVPTIALVGKGVTFDSGGISLKPPARMEEMKHDMTGAATVMGTLALAAMRKIPCRVYALMAFTENMPDGDAITPGCVIPSRQGKTVEITNTDAEGRLILADALDYAQDLKPDYIIDVATLTGAVSIALGKHFAGILGNDKKLIRALQKSGRACDEFLWELPLTPEYFEDLKSDVADMKNSGNDTAGGTIRAASFLAQFIRPGTRWAHLDIAGTAYSMGHLPYCPKRGASGFFVRTLTDFLEECS